MNLDLFGQNLVVVLAMLFASGFAYLIFAPWLQKPIQKKKKKEKKKDHQKLKIPKKKAARLLAASLLGAFFIQGLAVHEYPGEQLPALFLMSLPWMLGIGATIWVWATRKWYNRTTGFVLIVCGFLFGLALLNDYYHYYPTLNDAFNISHHQVIGGRTNQTVIRYSATKTGTHGASLEASLQNIGQLPAQGQIYGITVPGTASHFTARRGWLYVPPAAFSPQKVNLPVIVLMAGSPGGPNDWLNGSDAAQTLSAFAAQHHGVAPLVAIVDENGTQANDTECVDSPHGNVETYLTVDVPNYLKTNFDVASNPASWAIGGLSDGGMCGIMLALRHPDTYRYFLDLGGDIGPKIGSQVATIADLFHGSQQDWQEHQPLYLLQHISGKASNLGGFFAVGSSDSSTIMSAVQSLYHQSVTSGLNVAYETTPGHHTFDVWGKQFRDALPWLSYQLGATVCSSQCE